MGRGRLALRRWQSRTLRTHTCHTGITTVRTDSSRARAVKFVSIDSREEGVICMVTRWMRIGMRLWTRRGRDGLFLSLLSDRLGCGRKEEDASWEKAGVDDGAN